MEELVIIVPTYHTYFDMVDRFLYLWKKNWPTCKYRLVLSTTAPYLYAEKYGVEQIINQEEDNICKRIYNAANLYRSEYYLVILEDCLITKPVNQDNINNLLDSLRSLNIQYCRLLDWNPRRSKKKTMYNYLNYLNEHEIYGITLMASICSFDFINDNFCDNITGQEFERLENENCKVLKNDSVYTNKVICTNNYFNLIHSIRAGKWIRKSYNLIRKFNPEINLNGRDIMPLYETIKQDIMLWQYLNIDNRVRNRIKKILKK